MEAILLFSWVLLSQGRSNEYILGLGVERGSDERRRTMREVVPASERRRGRRGRRWGIVLRGVRRRRWWGIDLRVGRRRGHFECGETFWLGEGI